MKLATPNQRRRLVIDRLQYHLLAVNLFYTTVVALMFAVLLFAPLIQQLLLPDLSATERGQAAAAFLVLHQRVWPPLIIALVCLAVHSLVMSHRIAGPLYQFRRVLGRVRDGDLTVRARLRRKDYLGAEAEIINQMSASLEQKLLELQRHGLDLCVGVDRLKTELTRDATQSSEEIERLLGLVNSRADSFRQSIVGFKTAPPDEEPVASAVTKADQAHTPNMSNNAVVAEA